MAIRYLIDSSAAIKYLNNTLPASSLLFLDAELDKEVNLSIVTKVEILAQESVDPANLVIAQQFADCAVVFPVDERIGEIAILIRKATKVKLPDVLIAATAIAYNFTLIADNDKDFNKIVSLDVGLKYINPFKIA